MANRLPAGPYKVLQIEDGVQAPWYIIPFDKHGTCEGPLTRDHLLATAHEGGYTDIFLFSHGWNNDWGVASARYDEFIQGYSEMRRDRDLRYPRPVKSLLVGVFWPSTSLVLPWESGPSFAALPGPAADTDSRVGEERQEIRELAQGLQGDDKEQFYRLAQQESIAFTDPAALKLAQILAPIYATTGAHDEIPSAAASPSPEEIVELWRALPGDKPSTNTSGDFGFADDLGGGDTATPEAAGIFSALDPRKIVRLATVLQMKDRAGTVGAYGVGPLLRGLMAAAPQARFHLIGHSYGCKVLLSALAIERLPGDKKVTSVLLLQPAVSYLCFAKDATGRGEPGGYRVALSRIEQPVLTTFSPHDFALRRVFHHAVLRKSDVGDMRIAGGAPSRFAALGGYGPGGCDQECREIPIKRIGEAYSLAPGGVRIYGLDGTDVIGGHGEINNLSTWWALYNQVSQ